MSTNKDFRKGSSRGGIKGESTASVLVPYVYAAALLTGPFGQQCLSFTICATYSHYAAAGIAGAWYRQQMLVNIRQTTEQDYKDLVKINNACIPAVNALDDESIRHLASQADTFTTVTLDGAIVGFVLCLMPGKDYESANYAWFNAKFTSFLYVDRVAFASGAQGSGLGKKLYAGVIQRARELQVPLVCEVNTEPRNEHSLAFHGKLGFREVGTASKPDGTAVVYLQLTC